MALSTKEIIKIQGVRQSIVSGSFEYTPLSGKTARRVDSVGGVLVAKVYQDLGQEQAPMVTYQQVNYEDGINYNFVKNTMTDGINPIPVRVDIVNGAITESYIGRLESLPQNVKVDQPYTIVINLQSRL